MFFLLPPKEITEPIVKNFKTVLSQINDINYQTLPLCNVKGIISSNVIPQIKAPNPAAATKSVQSVSVPLIKKSAAATKSKPASLTLNLVTKCSSCGWDFPLSFEKADKDSHGLRCKQGLGEKDPKLWESCKGNKEDFKSFIMIFLCFNVCLGKNLKKVLPRRMRK